MKKLILILTLLTYFQSNAQNKWFETYSDTMLFVNDANKIVKEFATKIKAINPEIEIDAKAIKNTKPYLIFYSPKNNVVNLPFWDEVIPQQKDFFTEIAGGKDEGKKVFGIFFNGFYIAHELGHAFASKTGKKFDNAYDSEYYANEIGILYWKASGQQETLKKCYKYAKKILKHLKNPVPENENYKEYITEHYNELAPDPYKYGYIQFSQFVEIYENNNISDFNTFVKN